MIRYFFSALLLWLFCPFSTAQEKLPLIRATSDEAIIFEGTSREGESWWLSPQARPDVHVITKSPGAQRVAFRTDIDSIVCTLKPGQQFDFIVLLHGKDSCYTRLVSKPKVVQYARQRHVSRDTLPFELTAYNNIKLKVLLNGRDTLYLKFDSGTTGLLLTHEAMARRTSLFMHQEGVREGKVKANYKDLPPYNTLKMGSLSWDSLRIYPVELSGQGTDGRFGWDLFDGRVVEIDFDKSLFIVHSKLPKKLKGYSKLPIHYNHTLFYIDGVLENRGKQYPNRFLFDNGYQRALMLDSSLVSRQQFPRDLPILKQTVMYNGQGKAFPVITVDNEGLKLGKTTLNHVPAQLLNTANPTGFPIHILGNEVLKRYNTILDFYNNCVYLKPNGLWGAGYAEASSAKLPHQSSDQ